MNTFTRLKRKGWASAWVILALGVLLVAVTATALSRSRGQKPSPITASVPVAAPASSSQPLPVSSSIVSVPPVAGQTITWSQGRVAITLYPGDRATRELSFKSSAALTNISVWTVPEIARFLTVQPSTFANVPANQSKAVNISFVIPSAAPQKTYEGTIHIRSGSSTLPQTLKILINVGLPPDPGEAGKATLEGIDSDKDGLRDDIQRYIALTYPNSARTRATLTQYGKATQAFLVDADDKQKSIEHAKERDRTLDCLYSFRPSETNTVRVQLRAQILNTSLRSKAYIKADAQLSGEIFSGVPVSQKKAQCNFNPDTMEN